MEKQKQDKFHGGLVFKCIKFDFIIEVFYFNHKVVKMILCLARYELSNTKLYHDWSLHVK